LFIAFSLYINETEVKNKFKKKEKNRWGNGLTYLNIGSSLEVLINKKNREIRRKNEKFKSQK
jgi:hypothetical protein